MRLLGLLFCLIFSTTVYASKIQQQGVKTHSDCLSASASDPACLLLDSQIYANMNSNLGISTSVASNALTISLTQADGNTAIATGLGAVSVGFRLGTSTTGGWTKTYTTGSLSLTIPSGTTIGTSSGIASYIYVYAMNNAGTPVLAVSLVGTFDQGTVQSSIAISGGSSPNGLYSSSAQTNLAITLLGRIKISESTAGTWATNSTEVAIIPFGSIQPPTHQTFLSGSGTYTPKAGVVWIHVEMVGGGGGGDGSGTSNPSVGSAATNSTFGTLTAGLGAPGGWGAVNGGNGGTTSIGSGFTGTGYGGGNGGPSSLGFSTSYAIGGNGGASCFGGAGAGGAPATVGSGGMVNTGGGGGGAGGNNVASNYSGAGGGAGGCIKADSATPLAASYAYVVGVGGTAAGSGGTAAGSTGGSGAIDVTEYYSR